MVTLKSHPTTALVITPSTKNVEFGTIRLESEQNVFSNGFMNVSKRTAFIRGKITDLEQVFKSAGQMFPGKIVYKQSFTPLYEGHKPKINPTTKEPVLTDGKMTYFESVYTEDSNAVDFWVAPVVAPVALATPLATQTI